MQTVSRAIALLRCFEGGTVSLSLVQLTHLMGLNKVNVLRLAQTLVAEGVLSKHPDTGIYSISYGLLSLARRLLEPNDIIERARPILKAAQKATGETAMLSLRDGYEAVVVHEIASPRPLKYTLGVGYRADLRLGAAGLAILSSLQDAEISDILARPAPERALGGTLVPKDVAAIVENAKKSGFITTNGMRVRDATGYAAPFIGPDNNVVGAISVVLPTNRDEDKSQRKLCEATVRQAARQMSSELRDTHGHT